MFDQQQQSPSSVWSPGATNPKTPAVMMMEMTAATRLLPFANFMTRAEGLTNFRHFPCHAAALARVRQASQPNVPGYSPKANL
jgi:hypothetical protein